MKTSSLVLFAFSILTISACTGQDNATTNQNNTENYEANRYADTYPAKKPARQTAPTASTGNLKMHPLLDSKTNSPYAYIPLPADWKINRSPKQGSPSITGTGGLKIYTYPFQSFLFSTDPMTQQAYQYAGQQMRQPAGVEGVVKQDLTQMTRNYGLKFVKQYPLPGVAQNDLAYANQLYSSGSMQKNYQAMGTEWTDTSGNQVLIVIHYIETAGAGMVTWGYSLQSLTAENGSFENAKNAYINGLSNTRYDQNHIAAYNQREASKANQSWAAHNQKMRNNQAAFDAQQRTYRETSDAINKASLDGYNSRSASMDRNRNAFNNYIHDETTVTDPANGQSYQVEGYSGQYWMNGNGEYIPSDNSLYNPNLDPNVNNQNWQQAPENPYGK